MQFGKKYVKKGLLPQDMSWEEKIDYIRTSSQGVPQRIVLDVATAQNNLEFNIAGNFLYIMSSVDDNHYIDVRFNEVRQPAHRLYQKQGFRTPFAKFFLTHPAQAAGEIVLIHGNLSKDFLDIIDNRSAESAVLDAILNELQGDTDNIGYGQVAIGAAATQIVAADATRKSVFIQHDIATGVGIVYLGFDNTVAANNAIVALNPGDTYSVDDYRGAIFGIRSAGATNVNYGEV